MQIITKTLNFFGLYTKAQLKESRNAMLELSAIQMDLIAELFTDKKVAFDVGYTMCAKRCAEETRKLKGLDTKINPR